MKILYIICGIGAILFLLLFFLFLIKLLIAVAAVFIVVGLSTAAINYFAKEKENE